MKNIYDRDVFDYTPFQGVRKLENEPRKIIPEVKTKNQAKIVDSLHKIFDLVPITSGMTLSFHHHLRNGDYVVNMVAEIIKQRNLKDMTLAISSIFPVHEPLVQLLENKNVTQIYSSYMNGPVARAISEGKMERHVVMQSHGRRAQSIEAGDLKIDVAFIAVPTSDALGNGSGAEGQSACGILGYAIADMKYAKTKVVISDHLVDAVKVHDIQAEYIDYIVPVDSIGNPRGIVSGTTKITNDPIGLKIARDTTQLLDELGILKTGFSFQIGAGGTSLAVAEEVKKIMKSRNIVGKFASGGITGYLVSMLEDRLFESLYDVQCFDLEAIRSYRDNQHHHAISASKYANPYLKEAIAHQLDCVILGATEIDLDFNVNVTTDSNGLIIGGSGGHQDTAYGAKLTIITTSLIKSRMPILRKKVTTITTPGDTVDVLVTERGIVINPKRKDLVEQLKNSKLNILPIEELMRISNMRTGIPSSRPSSSKAVGVVEYRDGTAIDMIWKI